MGTGSRDRICHAGSSLGRHDRGRCQPLAPGAFLSQLVMLNARADTRDAPHFVHSFPLGGVVRGDPSVAAHCGRLYL